MSEGTDIRTDISLKKIVEDALTFYADDSCNNQRKSPFYYNKDYRFNRCLVLSILREYLRSEDSVSTPVRCVDLLGNSGVNGLLWKHFCGDKVEVIINSLSCEGKKLIEDNAAANGLQIITTQKDPCVLLHEKGYNFIYLDCTIDASHYFDAAFRNIARSGIFVITAKDDSSLHGGTYDVALRRYGGRIVRTGYAAELGIRLFLGALARTAARYNKAIKVLCSTVHKSTFTVAVMSQKGPILANKCLENLRSLKHCMVCEERVFYPASNGFPIDPKSVRLGCKCGERSPGESALELGPLWAGEIFDSDYLLQILSCELTDPILKPVLLLIHEESRCPSKESDMDGVKRQKFERTPAPEFYYNLHKHHPAISQPLKLNKVIQELRNVGFRASKTHFDPLAVRTNAPLSSLFEIMKGFEQ